jgi:upstream activation factor subunit UAF30
MEATLEYLKSVIDEQSKELKALRKDIRKIRQHIEDPLGEKAKARSQNNGFRKPQVVSDELRAFLNLGPEDRISRADVTRRINEYVTEKGLKNGQNLTMDAALKSLLAPPDDVQVTFLNIQKYINRHYIKEVVEAAPVEAAPVEKKKPTLKKK